VGILFASHIAAVNIVSVIMGNLVALTAGLYVALNLLGAGGGRPNDAQTVQIVNATLCTVWFFSSSFGGSVLNTVGPSITASLGVCGYMVYVGSLWYFDRYGKEAFPIAAGVIIGVSSHSNVLIITIWLRI
jgi:hypothetical protein